MEVDHHQEVAHEVIQISLEQQAEVQNHEVVLDLQIDQMYHITLRVKARVRVHLLRKNLQHHIDLEVYRRNQLKLDKESVEYYRTLKVMTVRKFLRRRTS